MALVQHPLHQAGMGFHVGADDEEGGLDMLGLEDYQDAWRPFRIGTVVEGERQFLRNLAVPMNDVTGGQASVFLVDNIAGALLDLQIAEAGLRMASP